MASGLKVIAALGAIAAGAAAIFAFKKHKELENYDYEDLDEDFDDCCGCDVICMYLGFAQAGFYKVENLVLGYAQDG